MLNLADPKFARYKGIIVLSFFLSLSSLLSFSFFFPFIFFFFFFISLHSLFSYLSFLSIFLSPFLSFFVSFFSDFFFRLSFLFIIFFFWPLFLSPLFLLVLFFLHLFPPLSFSSFFFLFCFPPLPFLFIFPLSLLRAHTQQNTHRHGKGNWLSKEQMKEKKWKQIFLLREQVNRHTIKVTEKLEESYIFQVQENFHIRKNSILSASHWPGSFYDNP